MLKKIRMYSFNTMLWIAKSMFRNQLSFFDVFLWIGVVVYVSKIESFGLYDLFVLIAIALFSAIVDVSVGTMEYLKDE